MKDMDHTRNTRDVRSDAMDRLLRALPALQRRISERMPEGLQADIGAATLHQLRALRSIRERGTVTMSELAESLGAASMSAATQMGDRLVRMGLVRRIHDEVDRRVVRLSLTPRARDLTDRTIAFRRQALEEALSCLNGEELETLVALTERVAGRPISGEDVQ